MTPALVPYGQCCACSCAVYLLPDQAFPDVCTVCRFCLEPICLAPAPETALRAVWRPLTPEEIEQCGAALTWLRAAVVLSWGVRA